MKLIPLLLCVSLSVGARVTREAEAKAEPEADPQAEAHNYQVTGGDTVIFTPPSQLLTG